MEHFYICNFSVVRHIDLSWNRIELSLALMYQKLVDLGWVYYDGKVHILEPETERSDSFHARRANKKPLNIPDCVSRHRETRNAYRFLDIQP